MAVRFSSGGEIDLTPSAALPSGADRAEAFARLLREMGREALPGIGPARAAVARMVAAAAGVEEATWVVRSGPALTAGLGLIVTATVSLAEHPVAV